MDTQQQFKEAMAGCRDIFSKKLHDYGAAWRIMRPSSVTDQIYIKANRIRSLEVKGVSLVVKASFQSFRRLSIMASLASSSWNWDMLKLRT